jgi:cation transport regulator ChaC
VVEGLFGCGACLHCLDGQYNLCDEARHHALGMFDDGGMVEHGLVYLADEHNAAWLGPAPDVAIAREVAHAKGPSGANRDYVLQLAEALHALGADDAHVFAIERALRDEASATPDA